MRLKRRHELTSGDIIKSKHQDEFFEIVNSFFTKYSYSHNYHGWINLKNKGRFYENSIYKHFESDGNYILVYDSNEVRYISFLSLMCVLSQINFKLLKWSLYD